MTDKPGRDHMHERLRALLAPERCAVILQELQEGGVGATSGLPALAHAVQRSSLVPNAARVAAMARDVGSPCLPSKAQPLPRRFGSNSNARLFAAAWKSGMKNLPGSVSVQ